ncbi:MAG: ABC transporter substrate-binding protein [Thermodesulfovibrionales bacterium]|nr:ABC transporter substrate-binding protein [Thermodesulfovibrionales bacterium]
MVDKRLFIYCALLILIVSFDPSLATSSPEIRVKDFRGKELHFQKPVSRIVCLIESALSALYMLGQKDKIVAIPTNVYTGDVFSYYARLDERIKNKKLPAPGNWEFVNIESVVSIRPDIVIIWSKQTETIRALEERGIPVFGVFISNFEDVYKEVSLLGKLIGEEKRADELIRYTREEVAKFQKRTQKIPETIKKKAYFMWAHGPLHTSCKQSSVNDLLTIAGCINVCPYPDEHVVVSIEKILKWNPDIIIMWVNDKKDPLDILKDSQWKNINAVKNGKVFELPEVFLYDLWTLKFQYAIKIVAKWAYPEFFKDIDLTKEKDRMLRMLYLNKLANVH